MSPYAPVGTMLRSGFLGADVIQNGQNDLIVFLKC